MSDGYTRVSECNCIGCPGGPDYTPCSTCVETVRGGGLPTMRGDLHAAVQMLAADNARMCEILMAADALAEQLKKYIAACTTPSRVRSPDYTIQPLMKLLDAYRIVRQGQ